MKFVNLAKYQFVLEPRYYFWGWTKSRKILARKSAADALKNARIFLPPGYNFKIWDCQRPRGVQLAMLASFKRRLLLKYPRKSVTQINKLVELFGGPLMPPLEIKSLGTHRNGGSFDLTIVDNHKTELFMGTDHDDLTAKAATDYFEKKKWLSFLEIEARENRRLLKGVLTKVGFKNYKPEWWHWSWDK